MNYVELHLGDWAKAVSHLSLVEEAVYLRLLRRYYTDEKPLPVELSACQRLAGARSEEERQAVVEVLREFFVLGEDGHRNKRADEEIAKYLEGEPEREAKKASERDRQARAREERRRLFDELRQRGVVPAYDTTTTELRRLLSQQSSEPVTRDIPRTTEVRPRDVTATQSPDTNTQEKQDQKPSSAKPPRKSARDAAIEYPLPEWIDRALWAKWIKGRTKPSAGLDENIAKLAGWRNEGHDPAAILREAIAGGWQGLYLPKITGAPHDQHSSGSRRPSVVERIRQNVERGERERANLTVIEGSHARLA